MKNIIFSERHLVYQLHAAENKPRKGAIPFKIYVASHGCYLGYV
jgi:hypothetical protein